MTRPCVAGGGGSGNRWTRNPFPVRVLSRRMIQALKWRLIARRRYCVCFSRLDNGRGDIGWLSVQVISLITRLTTRPGPSGKYVLTITGVLRDAPSGCRVLDRDFWVFVRRVRRILRWLSCNTIWVFLDQISFDASFPHRPFWVDLL